MPTQKINIGGISVDVEFKDIKNVHLSVYPPTGRVRIAAPARMSIDTIRLYAIAKLGWIKKQQKKLQEQQRETPREYLDRESHYVWGRRYLLKVQEADQTPSVELKHNQMVMTVRPDAGKEKKEDVVASWYREQLRLAMSPLIAKWEALMGVKSSRIFVQRMKTKWGSCNPHSRSIRLNSELAKKSPECLEYVIVHELVHLLEPTHNHRFVALMDKFMPQWRQFRDELNRMPLSHQEWEY
jgi:predicted metal-dependent hydrolase